MNAQIVKEIGAQRFTVTAGQIVAVIMSIVISGGGAVWWLSSEWENVTLRLDQTEAAAKAAGEAAADVRESLAGLAADSANHTAALMRVERKVDDMRSGETRYGSTRPPG